MSSSETPNVSSAMTGMPRAIASIAAVELTVTSPSAVSSARAIGPRRDHEVGRQRRPSRLARADRGSRRRSRWVCCSPAAARSFTTTRRDGIGLGGRDEQPRHPHPVGALARDDRLRREDEVGRRRRTVAGRRGSANGRRASAKRCAQSARSAASAANSRISRVRVQHEQVALRAVDERRGSSRGSRCPAAR